MSDLIERDDVLKEIWEWIENREYQYTNATHWLQKRIEAIPSAKDKADRKTEPTISKMEQVETMSCAECKHRPIGAEICEEPCHYEPQTDWHYDEQDATWYPYKHEDEPQTERSE